MCTNKSTSRSKRLPRLIFYHKNDHAPANVAAISLVGLNMAPGHNSCRVDMSVDPGSSRLEAHSGDMSGTTVHSTSTMTGGLCEHKKSSLKHVSIDPASRVPAAGPHEVKHDHGKNNVSNKPKSRPPGCSFQPMHDKDRSAHVDFEG